MLQIGQGEKRNLIFEIDDKNSIMQSDDTVLFAIKDKNGTLKYSYAQTVDKLSKTDTTYTFNVTLGTATTIALDIDCYFYDLTLIDANSQKISLTKPCEIDIMRTVGASIVEGA